MPNPSIGSATFLTLSGLPTPGGPTIEEITRAVAEGVALRDLGRRTRPFECTSLVDVETAGAIKTRLEEYQALRGTLVTVVDAFGSSWAEVAVLNVAPSGGGSTRRILGAVGGLTAVPAYLIECVWTLQLTTFPA